MSRIAAPEWPCQTAYSRPVEKESAHVVLKEKLSRRGFLKANSMALGAQLLFIPKQTKANNARQPNVLMILSDQESQVFEEEAGAVLRLPNRKLLERQSIRLTQAFVVAPQCSASRSAVMTGLYPHEAGVVTNVDESSLGRALSPIVPTLGKVFRSHGYTTAYLGKWHLTNGLGGGVSPDHDHDALRPFGFDHYHYASDARGHGQLVEATADWIRSGPSSPWLLIVSFPFSPHDITRAAKLIPSIQVRPGIELPPNFDDDLRTKPRPQEEFLQDGPGKASLDWGKEDWLRYRSYYLDLIERTDGYLGTILGALRRRSDAEDTIVVYTSDHGDMGGAHHLPFKGPFMYDELLRVPLLISYPRRFRAPVVSDSMVSNVDLAPTLAALSGIEWPRPLPGKDFSLLFDHPKAIIRTEIFAEYYGAGHWVNPIRTIRTAEWKYNLYVAPGREIAAEMYDLKRDPGEVHNIANLPTYRNVRQSLAQNLLEWRRNTKDPLL